MNERRFVILDRDGTLIHGRPYLADPQEVELVVGAAQALGRLRDRGMGIIVVTNQSGVGRGYFDLDRLAEIHGRVEQLLQAAGVRTDGIFFCPHTPDDGCACRKPRPGLVERAAEELDFDPRWSFVVGDNVCDIELGRAVGATTLLVRTGYGAQVAAEGRVRPDHIVDDLAAACDTIEGIVWGAPERGVGDAIG